MRIQPIVEGQGEVEAFPILLRRLLQEAGVYSIDIGHPIRQKRGQLLRPELLEKAILMAYRQHDCRSVLIMIDADDDCPKELKTKLEAHTEKISTGIPCKIVIPKCEYEAWFLASLESLRGKRQINKTACSPKDPESIRDAKGMLSQEMPLGNSYLATVDQAKLSAAFDMRQAYRKSRSFKHLVSALGELLRGMGIPLDEWPPEEWIHDSE